MPRLTREQSQAETREKLLAAARTVFARDGYDGASVERVAEEAGFSKGAVYSNFRSKEDLFLAVSEAPTLVDLPGLVARIDAACGPTEIVDILADWADAQAQGPGWSLLVLEHVRRARQKNSFGDREAQLFRNIWKGLGQALVAKLPTALRSVDPETLGAMVGELAYAPSMGFSAGPTAGDLVRLALKGLIPTDGMPDAGRLRSDGPGTASEG